MKLFNNLLMFWFSIQLSQVASRKIPIDDNFLYCFSTTNLIDTFIIEDDIFNIVNTYKNFNKEYFQIRLSSKETVNVYSLDGNLYQANCTIKSKIWVPTWVSKCTKEILVFLNINQSQQVFLNPKTKIISNDTSVIDCVHKEKIFYIGQYEFKQINDKIFIKKQNLKLFKISKTLASINEQKIEFEKINNTIQDMRKFFYNHSKNTSTPISLPLKNLIINENKLIKLLEESEVSDQITKFFVENILKKKILMGITVISFYLTCTIFITYFFYVKISNLSIFKKCFVGKKNNQLIKKDIENDQYHTCNEEKILKRETKIDYTDLSIEEEMINVKTLETVSTICGL